MIVVDASALIEVLLVTTAGESIESRLFDPGATLHSPHLIDLEVAQGLRRLVATGNVSEARAIIALADMSQLSIQRYPHGVFIPRIWELRHNFTPYDAAYVALAEIINAPLLTLDERLATATRTHTLIPVV